MGFVHADEMERGSPLAGWSARFFHSPSMTFGQWDVADGAADLHEHAHPQEEVWIVLDGAIVLVIDGVQRLLRAGDAAVIEPDTPHAAKVVGPCRVVAADHPVRLDLPLGR